jgi:hypothetical protein
MGKFTQKTMIKRSFFICLEEGKERKERKGKQKRRKGRSSDRSTTNE